jgi:hypothetical protein
MKEPTDMGFETLPIDTYSIDISIVLKMPDLSNAKSVAQDLYPTIEDRNQRGDKKCTFL